MNTKMVNKVLFVLIAATAMVACQSIPEWDKEMAEAPVEDGRCPDFSGRYNYEHLGANDTRAEPALLGDTLTSELPIDRLSPTAFKASGAIHVKIYKGKYFDPYPGKVIVTLAKLDREGRKYHVRVDWDLEGMLGEYDLKVHDAWICSGGSLFKVARTTLHEDASPREINPKDYRRIYLLPNGNIRIDRKHTFIPKYLEKQGEIFRYFESRVFARVP
jgi:hypothetical protein